MSQIGWDLMECNLITGLVLFFVQQQQTSQKGHSISHKKAEKPHGTTCHVIVI